MEHVTNSWTRGLPSSSSLFLELSSSFIVGGLMVWRAVPTGLLRIAACVAVDANNRFVAEMAHLDVHACIERDV
jgi:hypothetical protein